MFRLPTIFSRRRPSPSPTRRRPVRFEALERRYFLSAPSITSFQVDSVDKNEVTISGHVDCEDPSEINVDFGGALDGETGLDSSGNFSFKEEASDVGTITATAEDESTYMSSAEVETELEDDEPAIEDYTVYVTSGNFFVVQGEVDDEHPVGLTVLIEWDGDEEEVAVSSSGTFYLNVPIDPGTETWVSAATEDWFEQTSGDYEIWIVVPD